MSLAGERDALSKGGLFAQGPTLVGVSGSRFSQPMVDAWLTGVPAGGGGGGGGGVPLRVLWLSLVERAALSWVQTSIRLSMRLSVPPERHGSFMCHFGDSVVARQQMRMANRFLGYVCLVDGEGVVRWHVHAAEPPTPEAVAGLQGLLRARYGSRRAEDVKGLGLSR